MIPDKEMGIERWLSDLNQSPEIKFRQQGKRYHSGPNSAGDNGHIDGQRYHSNFEVRHYQVLSESWD